MERVSQQAADYAIRQLMSRAGADPAAWPSPVVYGQPGPQPGVYVVPCAGAAWDALLQREPMSLDWRPSAATVPPSYALPFDDPIPVLFWGEGCEAGNHPFAEKRKDGTVVFYADVVAATLFMLTRWEESVVATRDEHGRFPAAASVAYRQGFLDRPVVDEHAMILRAWLQALRPTWQPEWPRFQVQLSHDVDTLRPFDGLTAALRTFGNALLTRRSVRQAGQVGRDFLWQLLAPTRTTTIQSIYTLADLSARYGLDSAFYWMAAAPSDYDEGYDVTSPLAQTVLRPLRQRGLEIGFHPGYDTLCDPDRLAREKARLESALKVAGGQPSAVSLGGRQHYLRFEAPTTWRHWEQVGLVYDSTLTYPEQEGFRCGTCHPFRPFDLEQNRELALWERPLIVMDRTLQNYRQLTPEAAEARILTLAGRCQRVGGVFTLLWHNERWDERKRPWWAMYRRVVGALAQMVNREPQAVGHVFNLTGSDRGGVKLKAWPTDN
ncbi:MAG: polysaccharide deacetylase family protein [Chloroflexota bacterium]